MPVGNDDKRDDSNYLSFLTSQVAFIEKKAINECQVKTKKSTFLEEFNKAFSEIPK